jgi:hypothetical protein
MMNDLLKSLPSDLQAYVVGRNSDELIFEFPSIMFDILTLNAIEKACNLSPYNFSIKSYKITSIKNLG